MTCREAANLLPVFFDGELDARQMRMVALHSTRCPGCEAELRRYERVQQLICERLNAAADEVDFEQFWAGIERRLRCVRPPWRTRLRARWSEGEYGWILRWPALAAAAAVAAFALFLLMRAPQPAFESAAPQVAAVDNAASIDSLDSDLDSVAVLNDPETRTTVLWVSDDSPVVGDRP
jgi:anti-sigma factor RsiW